MAYGNTLATPNYKILPARTKTQQPLELAGFVEHLYTAFAVGFAVALICMALRVIFALFIFQGPINQAVIAITNPLIAPFTDIFKDGTGMIQISTMTAFTAYYLVYGVVSRYLSVFRQTFTA